MTDDPGSGHIAVIGLACRFPGARDVREFWENLVGGVDAITRVPRRRLPSANGSGEEYAPAGGYLTDPEWFDAGYFGYSPREARIIDPQQRVFLECAVEALESAACDPDRYPGSIGVYAGGTDTEYAAILRSRRAELPGVTNWDIRVATGADFIGTRAAYKLGLRGPAVTVRAACATSLVAVHVAVQALLGGDCDVALAGGACVHVPATPSEYTEGGIISPDGACRAFDAAAKGIVGGDGVGLVVLKRLSEAVEDGDPIRAVILGSAVNNDGADRIGYTAPSVEGQADVIRAAHLVADVDPATITYVEAHGTATPIGDPIEVAALTRAFGGKSVRRGFCGLGSVKTGIGHTDAAAGVAGLIKTVMALENGVIPPSLHFTQPNPQIDFSAGPFRVVTSPYEWRPEGVPRRAGVSSFGMGGTNAHVVLEEFDVRLRQTVSDVRLRQTVSPVVPQRRPQLLVLSAGSPAALGAAMTRLADHLPVHPKASLASVAWTLQTGRRQLPYRGYAVVNGIGDAGEVLAGRDPVRLVTSENPARTRSVTFVFSETTRAGGGMAEPIFRNVIEECRDAAGAPAEELAGLAWQCALAQMWARWGVTPDAVLGIGAGVLAAAVVSGALPLRVAARWAAERPAGRTFTGLGLGTARIPLLVADDPGGVGAALSKLVDDPARVFLRIGDGPAFGHAGKPLVIPGAGDEWSLLSAAGRLWQTGVDIAWEAVHDGLVPVRTVLPAYPFERQRYVVEPVASSPGEQTPERLAAADARQVVAGLFGEMLGLGPDDLDRDESFFDLGGDSLVATKILVAIRKIYPIELALRSMFEAPTVNTFAALVEERLAEQTGGVRGSAD